MHALCWCMKALRGGEGLLACALAWLTWACGYLKDHSYPNRRFTLRLYWAADLLPVSIPDSEITSLELLRGCCEQRRIKKLFAQICLVSCSTATVPKKSLFFHGNWFTTILAKSQFGITCLLKSQLLILNQSEYLLGLQLTSTTTSVRAPSDTYPL